MKKITCLITAIFFTINVKAQQPLLFKVKYLPNHIYKMSMQRGMSVKMISPGKLKTKKNMPSNLLMQGTNTTMQTIIKTGGTAVDNSLPITMQITDMAVKLNAVKSKIPMPKNPFSGQLIYGQYDADGKIHIDSITGKKVNERQSMAMAGIVNISQGHIKFPEKPMTIGDVFTQDTLFNIPGNGAAKINATYALKLVDIKNNKAYFDINISMKGNIPKDEITMIKGKIKTQQNEVNVTGSGTGKLIFDTEKNYTESKNEVLNIRSSQQTGNGKGAVMNVKMTMDLKNQIEPI